MRQAAVLLISALVSTAASSEAPVAAPQVSAAFPGDHGRPGDGLPMAADAKPPPRPQEEKVAAIPIRAAVELAKAAVAACRGFKVGVSIIDAAGAPKLYYIGDGASGGHAYTAFRKAYTALTFGLPSSKVAAIARADANIAAHIASDPNLLAWAGGVPIRRHGMLIGAVGVSGAEPSASDEACAETALSKDPSSIH